MWFRSLRPARMHNEVTYPQNRHYLWTLARNSADNRRAARMKKIGLADWRTSDGLPSASDPETEADRTPRESCLACMAANREPSNQSVEIDREATVCTASRRFLPFSWQRERAASRLRSPHVLH